MDIPKPDNFNEVYLYEGVYSECGVDELHLTDRNRAYGV
jgi:hypothetical protein